MELKVKRKILTDLSAIGDFSVDGARHSFSLEDKDRNLFQNQPLSEIKLNKVHGRTAIPKGRYEVIVNYSNRFKKQLPLLLNVPGFEGVRIHPGNTCDDTEGCILLGAQQGKNWIGQSRIAFDAFMEKLNKAIKTEKIYITIE